jgi:uncharacterized protein (TIGR00730 family)
MSTSDSEDPVNSDPNAPPRKRHIDDLVSNIKNSADKLAKDGSSRGDLKILSRAIRELRYAFKVFAPYRYDTKVSVFGSARTPESDPAFQQAVRLGELLAAEDWYVITGAAAGIMEAGHRGAGREKSMGLNILLPFEQDANPVIAGDHKLVNMKYFFTRKLMFVKESDAIVCLPGGFGTLDEALEVLTLLQTGKRELVPVVLLNSPGGTFWNSFQEFIVKELLGGGMISVEDRHLYSITDDCEAAVEEIRQFYSVYHSMRYVQDKLVFRLNKPLGDALLAGLNSEFRDLLKDGTIEQGQALPGERDEPYLKDLPRLVLNFNRRNQGRLRRMIDSINAGKVLS